MNLNSLTQNFVLPPAFLV